MYYLYEIDFADNYSICIRSLWSDVNIRTEELQTFLAPDIEKFGEIVGVSPIEATEALRFYDLDNFNNWPVLE